MAFNLYETGSNKPISVQTAEDAEALIAEGSADFNPEQEVFIKDIDKGVMKVKGVEASNLLKLGVAGVVLANDEDIMADAKEKQYGSVGQKALGIAERTAKGASLGFAPALTRMGIELATPKGSPVGEKYKTSVRERAEIDNPLATVGEIGGLVYGGPAKILASGAAKVGLRAAELAGKGASVAPKIISSAVNSPVAQKAIERGVEFGVDAGVTGMGYEAGRQLSDGDPLNAEAIIGAGAKEAKTGALIGLGFGAAENKILSGIKSTKKGAKEYLDKLTKSGKSTSGEVITEVNRDALKKEIVQRFGTEKPFIVAEEMPDGSYLYKSGKDSGPIDISPNSKGLDLTNDANVRDFGTENGIDFLDIKLKDNKLRSDETIADIIAEEAYRDAISKRLNANKQYLPINDEILLDQANEQRKKMFSEGGTFDRKLYNDILSVEEDILLKGSKKDADFLEKTYQETKHRSKQIKEKLNQYDWIKDTADNGTKKVHIYNTEILPKNIPIKEFRKGVQLPSQISSKIAKQYGMTAKQMQKMGGKRLDEVADFILQNYPKQGNFIKRAMTDVDVIFENITKAKDEAGRAIGDLVEEVFNKEEMAKRITNKDIADMIETQILPEFVDATTGNPLAGFSSEYKIVSDFANEYRNNGFKEVTTNGMKKRIYNPLDIKELRDIRRKLDDKIKWSSENQSTMQDTARKLRTLLEDKIVGQVKISAPELIDKYNDLKKTYSIASQAEKVVDAAVNKSAQKNKFSLFYSGVGASVGAALGGPVGAMAGGYFGGKVNNALREYSGSMTAFVARGLSENVAKYERRIDSSVKSFFTGAEKGVRAYVMIPNVDQQELAERDYLRLSKEMLDKEAMMEKFMDDNEFLFEQYPETSMGVVLTMQRATEFLHGKFPVNPYIGNPFKEKTWKPSAYEMGKFMRYREAVKSPNMILEQVKAGYVTPEATEVLKEVYPETLNKLREKFIEQASKKGANLDVQKRVEVYKLFGIQMDSFMNGKSFAELQGESNAQALETANGGQFKQNNALKMKDKDLTLGNSTI